MALLEYVYMSQGTSRIRLIPFALRLEDRGQLQQHLELSIQYWRLRGLAAGAN